MSALWPATHASQDVVDESLSYFTGAQCDALIRNATQQVQTMLNTASGVAAINKMFNLCTPLNVKCATS